MTEPDHYCKQLKDPEIGPFGFLVVVRLTTDVEKTRSGNGRFDAARYGPEQDRGDPAHR
jgi:hypothetical protein